MLDREYGSRAGHYQHSGVRQACLTSLRDSRQAAASDQQLHAAEGKEIRAEQTTFSTPVLGSHSLSKQGTTQVRDKDKDVGAG